MTDPDGQGSALDEHFEAHTAAGGRRRKTSSGGRARGCLAVLIVLGIVAALLYVGVTRGVDFLQDQFRDPEDYPGPGSGEVTFEVVSGDSIPAMGSNLVDAGVVASAEAFTDAASGDPCAPNIQAGFYPLKKKMKAADALQIMCDPDQQVKAGVTIPEGFRVADIVSRIVEETEIPKKSLTRLLAAPEQIGLPAEAEGNPEGYLFPATYTVNPTTSAKDLLSEMVAMTTSVEEELDIANRAADVGLTAHEVITVASILEYEANNADDYAKVARVIYNRLEEGMALQLDSTVSYVSKREGDVWTTPEERANDSLYNTYEHAGLPPGPIGSPGKTSIEAALNPAAGDWLYFVPDFESGTTLFAATYDEHLANVEKAKEYCRTHEDC